MSCSGVLHARAAGALGPPPSLHHALPHRCSRTARSRRHPCAEPARFLACGCGPLPMEPKPGMRTWCRHGRMRARCAATGAGGPRPHTDRSCINCRRCPTQPPAPTAPSPPCTARLRRAVRQPVHTVRPAQGRGQAGLLESHAAGAGGGWGRLVGAGAEGACRGLPLGLHSPTRLPPARPSACPACLPACLPPTAACPQGTRGVRGLPAAGQGRVPGGPGAGRCAAAGRCYVAPWRAAGWRALLDAEAGAGAKAGLAAGLEGRLAGARVWRGCPAAMRRCAHSCPPLLRLLPPSRRRVWRDDGCVALQRRPRDLHAGCARAAGGCRALPPSPGSRTTPPAEPSIPAPNLETADSENPNNLNGASSASLSSLSLSESVDQA